jgi:aryl-alcohol dehydrogenase-like predicted oxidoreductase
MSMGDAWGFGANAEHSGAIIDAYAEAGGNFLDTANKYHEGHSEQIVGEHIGGDRDRWVVATKYTLSMRAGDPNAAGNSRKNMMRSVEGSLKRLDTDYIDLLWVHAWDFTTPTEEVLRGLDDLVRAGKLLYVGISDAPAWVVSSANTMAELRGWSAFVGLQVQYSLLERTVERELLPMAAELGITTTAWAPLAGGVLTGKYTRGGGAPDTKRSNDDRLTPRNLEIARAVDAVADEIDRSSAQVALNWVRQRGRHIIPIVGARKLEQISDLLACTDFALTDAQMARLDQASAIELGFPHDFLGMDAIRPILYGDLEPQLDLPRGARKPL